jgi:GntR family carbon starvation induced transcriptional regulator
LYKSITTRTYDRLRAAIVTNRFRPGSKLGIDVLRAELEASPGAVREALAALTSEGLVTAEPQRGFTVSLVSRKDLVDLTEARVAIELFCLQSSIEHGDLDWEGRILALSHQLSRLTPALLHPESEDALRWHQTHELFHSAITSACSNAWWLKLRRHLYIQSERYRWLSGPTSNYDRDINAEHNRIAEATVARDTETAKSLLEDHLRCTAEIVLRSNESIWDGGQ